MCYTRENKNEKEKEVQNTTRRGWKSISKKKEVLCMHGCPCRYCCTRKTFSTSDINTYSCRTKQKCVEIYINTLSFNNANSCMLQVHAGRNMQGGGGANFKCANKKKTRYVPGSLTGLCAGSVSALPRDL